MSHTSDADDLARFGYSQRLDRTIGAFTSFCVSFSMVSVTTATSRCSAMVLGVAVNAAGIRRVTPINNIGATTER
jgi:hypothetical protein